MGKINRRKNIVTIEESVDRYLSNCRHRHLAEETIKTYTLHLTKFYMGMPEMSISEVKQQDVVDFITEFEDTHDYGTRSMNNLMRYINVFFKFCKKEHLTEETIVLSYRKQEKKLQFTPTDSQVRLLLKEPDIETCSFNELSCHVIVMLIISTGLRINSIVNIRFSDLHLDKGFINVKITKSKREERVFLPKRMIKTLKNYIECINTGSDYLFTNSKDEVLNSHSASMNVIRFCRDRGVPECNCHSLRRYFACSFLKETGDLNALKVLLHHSDISITQKYVESLNIESYKIESIDHNPLNKFL